MEQLLCNLLQLYFFILLARIVLSWFPVAPGSALSSVFGVVYSLTEPVLGPLRRMIPPLMLGGMGVDLSPLVVFFGIRILISAACG